MAPKSLRLNLLSFLWSLQRLAVGLQHAALGDQAADTGDYCALARLSLRGAIAAPELSITFLDAPNIEFMVASLRAGHPARQFGAQGA